MRSWFYKNIRIDKTNLSYKRMFNFFDIFSSNGEEKSSDYNPKYNIRRTHKGKNKLKCYKPEN